MWNDSTELVVASNGQIYVAPVGTALPAGPATTLNAAFVGLGLATEDGVKLSVSPTITEHKAWQSRHPVRRDLTGQEIQAAFQLEQWNESTVVLAFGGGAITTVSGGYRYDFVASGAALDERAMVIDAQDGTRKVRYVFPRGNVTEAVETTFSSTSPALLPITFKVLEPADGSASGYILFDDAAAFAAGS